LTPVFKYLLRVYYYLTIAYNNHPVTKICIAVNRCAHVKPASLHGIIRRSKRRV